MSGVLTWAQCQFGIFSVLLGVKGESHLSVLTEGCKFGSYTRATSNRKRVTDEYTESLFNARRP